MFKLPLWWIQYWRQELKKLLAYRIDFWIQFLVPVVGHFIIAYFLWNALFASQPGARIGSYSLQGMLWYSFVAAMMERIVMGGQWKDGVSTDIYQGSLTKYLLYPRPYLPTKAAVVLATVSIGWIQLSLLLTLARYVYPTPAEWDPTLWGWMAGLALGSVGALVYFVFLSSLELIAFWADNVWSLQVMLRFTVQILGGVLLPISWYPDWAQSLLYFTPFPHLFFVPVRCVLGQATPLEALQSLGVLLVWGCLGLFVYTKLWLRGLRTYSGVGI
jgi:ABC-2 type transport system permease protein